MLLKCLKENWIERSGAEQNIEAPEGVPSIDTIRSEALSQCEHRHTCAIELQTEHYERPTRQRLTRWGACRALAAYAWKLFLSKQEEAAL